MYLFDLENRDLILTVEIYSIIDFFSASQEDCGLREKIRGSDYFVILHVLYLHRTDWTQMRHARVRSLRNTRASLATNYRYDFAALSQ